MIDRSPQLVKYIVDNYDNLVVNKQLKMPAFLIRTLYESAELRDGNAELRDGNAELKKIADYYEKLGDYYDRLNNINKK